ncbi:hypothetical protein LRR81_07900 [Metabacillus sp. GX 13764]|uniref:hypothetical protein n=1 Tax=Metabacillus kandeliae TaxID=2900151 RepID=UPI001E45F899|nr:hypothetical protein [Metabacillus kandeliae]MCD7034154.1 hypothetical protein [Metabacillus kandeliae]
MEKNSQRLIPLIVTVGQVVIFPYYIIWLKEVSMSFTLFAWLFAVFSFSAAWGYRTFSVKKPYTASYIFSIYIGMGLIYMAAGWMVFPIEMLPYAALLMQIGLGFLQGYFRAWHIQKPSYRVHAVHHYLLVGIIMLGLSFVKIFSPSIFLILFGVLLFISGGWEWRNRKAERKYD